MSEEPGDDPVDGGQRHWAEVYRTRPADQVSWFEAEPITSLALIDLLVPGHDADVVDVGGGASALVDVLVARGFPHVTVVDIAGTGLAAARSRIGADARVSWVEADVRTWVPDRAYGLWHDRAVLHFLAGADVLAYRRTLDAALAPDGAVVLGAFAPGGPTHCSGLPVTRYDAAGLAAVLGDGFTTVAARCQVHVTPGGVEQPFTWVAARRTA